MLQMCHLFKLSSHWGTVSSLFVWVHAKDITYFCNIYTRTARHVRYLLKVFRDLTVVYADRVSARVTVLGEQAVETLQAVRPSVPHDVPLSAQLFVAFQARKVFHVPGAAFRFRTLVGQDDLRKPYVGTSIISLINARFYGVADRGVKTSGRIFFPGERWSGRGSRVSRNLVCK